MRLVCGIELDPCDEQDIQKGYETRIEKKLSDTLEEILNLYPDDPSIRNLSWLVSNNMLDIKIAWKKEKGIYHEKIGVFLDQEGNYVSFSGSSNETKGGLVDNWESIDVYCSWKEKERCLSICLAISLVVSISKVAEAISKGDQCLCFIKYLMRRVAVLLFI